MIIVKWQAILPNKSNYPVKSNMLTLYGIGSWLSKLQRPDYDNSSDGGHPDLIT